MSLSSDGTVMTMPVQPQIRAMATAGALAAMVRGGLLFSSSSFSAAGAATGATTALAATAAPAQLMDTSSPVILPTLAQNRRRKQRPV